MNTIDRDLRANLPLSETTFFILLSLALRPRHGYAIMKDVQTLSNSRVVLSTGTLYGALKRLLEQGWIARVDDPDENDTERERKAYALTDFGHRILDAEIARLQSLVAAANRRAVRVGE